MKKNAAPVLLLVICLIGVVAFSTRWHEMTTPWTSVHMPVPVPDVLECFKQLEVKEFTARGELRDEFVAFQRLVASAYPVQVSDSSKNIAFFLKDKEKVCASAEILCQGKEGAVAHCAN